MTVYLDVIFFMNLLYQYGILKVLTLLLKMKRPNIRILLGAAIGSVMYCICIVMRIPLEAFGVKMIAGIVIGVVTSLVSFMPVHTKKIPKIILMQCMLSFCLSGLLQFLPIDVQTEYMVLSASGAVIFLCLFSIKVKKLIWENLRKENSICRIKLYHKGKSLETNALIDTGNHLKDPFTGEAVIIIQKSVADKLLEEDDVTRQNGYRMIPYESIGKSDGILEAFRLERLIIMEETKQDGEDYKTFCNMICAIHSKDYKSSAYEVILHPLMF